MRIQALFCACIVSLGFASAVSAKEKPSKRGKHYDSLAAKSEKHTEAKFTHPSGEKEPWIAVDVQIGAPERIVIQEYTRTCVQPARGKKSKGLPPGLAKKVARGGSLPPGWQKKCVRGEVMPPEIFKQCHPLPPEIVVKLPTPPHGTILVAVHGKVVRLVKATREILDVFDVI